MRYQRCSRLLAGQRAIADTATGSERKGGKTREESRPDAEWPYGARAGRLLPGKCCPILIVAIHPYAPRSARVIISAELNGHPGLLSMLLPVCRSRFRKNNKTRREATS